MPQSASLLLGSSKATFIECFRHRTGLTGVVVLVVFILLLSTTTVAEAGESDVFPLPFVGTYQSLASEAHERSSRDKSSWVMIPQNVYLSLAKDNEIVELQLKIEVLDDIGRVRYPIDNRMWLRLVADNRLEVYKLNKTVGNFEKVGQGACTSASCSYQYVVLAKNNGNPYKQRYMSTITWSPDNAPNGFHQSGSLSAEVTDEATGQKSWFVFKTWTNQFEAMPAH